MKEIKIPYNHVDGGNGMPPAVAMMKDICRGIIWLNEQGGTIDFSEGECTLTWYSGRAPLHQLAVTVTFSPSCVSGDDADEILCVLEEALRQAKEKHKER